MTTPEDIIAACKADFAPNANNCSGFVKAVATDFGVALSGVADDIVDEIQAPGWTVLPDGPAAATAATAGKLVIAGLKGADQAKPDPHGHVVVVVDGPLAHGLYPTAYWGSLGGTPGQAETINYAWTVADRDKVIYSAIDV
jgi:hypothetical protein